MTKKKKLPDKDRWRRSVDIDTTEHPSRFVGTPEEFEYVGKVDEIKVVRPDEE